MAEIITKPMRIALKKMAQVSQCVRVVGLLPTPEQFAIALMGDMRIIANRVNGISTKINDVLDRYSSIPGEFLLEGFDDVLDKLGNISDYAKIAITETTNILNSAGQNVRNITDSVGSAVSSSTSAVLQIGSGVTNEVVALGSNLKLSMTGDGSRTILNDTKQDGVDVVVDKVDDKLNDVNEKVDEVGGAIKDWTDTATTKTKETVDELLSDAGKGVDDVLNSIGDVKDKADKVVDESIAESIKKVENAKRKVEETIGGVRTTFNKLTKDFDDAFGFLNKTNSNANTKTEGSSISDKINEVGNVLDISAINSVANVTDEVTHFINNFNIGKTVTSMGGIVASAGVASLAMDLLPSINIDRMLKDIIGGIDSVRVDKITELINNKKKKDSQEADLLEIPDTPWKLNKDDLEKYDAKAYEKYLDKYAEKNDNARKKIMEKMQNVKTLSDLLVVTKDSLTKNTENKSALKAMQNVRCNAIKAKQIEKYRKYITAEVGYLKKDCLRLKNNIKREWDIMMSQYKTAISEITKFFTIEGCGGCEVIDECCDRINDDATKIIELCASITIELTNSVSNVAIPYSIGLCVDMPVNKILNFFKDIQIIITFLKDLIGYAIDIIVQLMKIAKIIFNGLQSLMDLLKKLKELFGIDRILDMVDSLVGLFKSKMVDGKILVENALSPIYYNETEDYEMRVEALEALLEDGQEGGNVDIFKYSDDIHAKKKHKKIFGGEMVTDDEIEELLEELEAKGEREIVAYRSPILNAAGDDFAGWIFYHAYAYDDMNRNWSSRKKRRRNKVIKKASKKNKVVGGRLIGGVAQLKKDKSFGRYDNGVYVKNVVTAYNAYYWYTKWTNDPTNCDVDMKNEGIDIVVPIQTTSNGSLIELSDGRRVFVEGKTVRSGDFVNVNGVRYRVK